MKKLICLCLALLMCGVLYGCGSVKTGAIYTYDYLVSALGFENKNDKITVFAEAIIINTEDMTAEKRTELLEGTGENIAEAFADLYKKTVQTLEFSHCAVAVISENISATALSQISDFCLKLDKLNLSIRLVSTPNVKKLLSCTPVTSLAMGYDIITMLETESLLRGIRYKNRFYETEALRKGELNIFSLPAIKTEQEKFFVDGISVFKEDEFSLKLNNEQAIIYSIATDSQKGGKFLLDSAEYEILTCLTTAQLSRNNPDTVIFTTKIKTTCNKQIIKKKIQELFEYSKQFETDIFSLGNILAHRDTETWQKVKNNYGEYYRNLKLRVIMK